MNLIEQLGGYEAAKGLFNLYEYSISFKYYKVFKGDFESAGYIDVFIPDLQKALLEYRRQHNIFVVEDRVVLLKNQHMWHKMESIYTVTSTDIYDGITIGVAIEYKNTYYGNEIGNIRHATDAEIKAGKRLEVNQ